MIHSAIHHCTSALYHRVCNRKTLHNTHYEILSKTLSPMKTYYSCNDTFSNMSLSMQQENIASHFYKTLIHILPDELKT